MRLECEALTTYTKCDLYGSPVQEEHKWCCEPSSLFYLIDGYPECRCKEHPCDPQEGREQYDLTRDEYLVAMVHVS
jgi:hypothetical protein